MGKRKVLYIVEMSTQNEPMTMEPESLAPLLCSTIERERDGINIPWPVGKKEGQRRTPRSCGIISRLLMRGKFLVGFDENWDGGYLELLSQCNRSTENS